MVFHLRNREAERSLQVSWNGVDLENTDTLKYLGVTLDRTLSYKTHIHNTTALALCYSTAENVAPVWERSAYAHLLNPELNQACRAITGCLKPTNIENLYLLAGIATPEIRRSVCARVARTKQVERETHSLFGHTPARSRLKSRKASLQVFNQFTSQQKLSESTNGREDWRRKHMQAYSTCTMI